MAIVVRIDGTVVTDKVPLSSIAVGYRAFMGEVSITSIGLDDDDASVGAPAGLKVVEIIETDTSPDTVLYSGRVAPRDLSRGTMPIGDARYSNIAVADRNIDFGGLPIGRRARPVETDVARVTWAWNEFLRGSPRASTDLDDTYLSTDNPYTMPAQVYERCHPFEVIQDCADATGKLFFITVDGELFYDREGTTAYQAGLMVTDVDPNLTDEFPPIEPQGTYDPDEFRSHGHLFFGTSGHVVASRQAAMNAHDYWGDVLTDDRAKTSADALARLQSWLDDVDHEEARYTFSLRLTSTQVDLIKPGQSFQLRSAAMGILNSIDVRAAEVAWAIPVPGIYIATISAARPGKLRRRHPSHVGGPGPGGGSGPGGPQPPKPGDPFEECGPFEGFDDQTIVDGIGGLCDSETGLLGVDGSALSPGGTGGTWTPSLANMTTTVASGIASFTQIDPDADPPITATIWELDDFSLQAPWEVIATFTVAETGTAPDADPPSGSYVLATLVAGTVGLDFPGISFQNLVTNNTIDGLERTTSLTYFYPNVSSEFFYGTGPTELTLGVRVDEANAVSVLAIVDGQDFGWVLQPTASVADLTFMRIEAEGNSDDNMPTPFTTTLNSLIVRYSESCEGASVPTTEFGGDWDITEFEGVSSVGQEDGNAFVTWVEATNERPVSLVAERSATAQPAWLLQALAASPAGEITASMTFTTPDTLPGESDDVTSHINPRLLIELPGGNVRGVGAWISFVGGYLESFDGSDWSGTSSPSVAFTWVAGTTYTMTLTMNTFAARVSVAGVTEYSIPALAAWTPGTPAQGTVTVTMAVQGAVKYGGTVLIDKIDLGSTGQPGFWCEAAEETEFPQTQVGTGNGTSTTFFTKSAYVPGSLEVWIDGVPAQVIETDPGTGKFDLYSAPELNEKVYAAWAHTTVIDPIDTGPWPPPAPGGYDETVDNVDDLLEAMAEPTVSSIFMDDASTWDLGGGCRIDIMRTADNPVVVVGGAGLTWDADGRTAWVLLLGASAYVDMSNAHIAFRNATVPDSAVVVVGGWFGSDSPNKAPHHCSLGYLDIDDSNGPTTQINSHGIYVSGTGGNPAQCRNLIFGNLTIDCGGGLYSGITFYHQPNGRDILFHDFSITGAKRAILQYASGGGPGLIYRDGVITDSEIAVERTSDAGTVFDNVVATSCPTKWYSDNSMANVSFINGTNFP